MIIAGLDEAALGPSLGPFCACVTRFRINTDNEVPVPLGRILAPAVSDKTGDHSRIPVGDSKRLYSSARGIAALEEGVLAFLEASGCQIPKSFSALIELLAGRNVRQEMEQTPWFEKADTLQIPLSTGLKSPGTEQKTEHLKSLMETSGVTFLPPRVCFVTAAGFNREIGITGGKGAAVRSLITPLMKTVLDNREDAILFTVDRQGGRRYYGEWLAELAPGAALRAMEEGPSRSAYRMGNQSVEFLVKADATCLEVALASMFSKYIREGAMRLFNEWWAERLPGVPPTAGYPQDAKRFIAEIEKAEALPADRDQLIRRL